MEKNNNTNSEKTTLILNQNHEASEKTDIKRPFYITKDVIEDCLSTSLG